MTVVTRFAPSPTGFLHIGGARTALFNWLFARHHKGQFLLRIEDTDRERSTQEAKNAILKGMAWLGLDHDGEVIYQSERQERHAEIVQQLLDQGHAYRCYRTAEELSSLREEAQKHGKPFRYDGYWRDRDPSEAPAGVEPAIRLKTVQEGQTVIRDAVQGDITFENEQLDDLVLMRSDGTPTYMLAVVVDDHDMGVTHIIRGDDHLTNAARQAQIYAALGWDIPQFAHIPLIHGPDGAKLSKRHGALGVEEYAKMGYLPEAMRNYLLRLGWSHGDDEIISTEQAIAWFNLESIGRSPARFDFTKLENLNGHYMREADNARLVELIQPILTEKLYKPLNSHELTRLLVGMDGLKARAKTIPELAENAAFYAANRPLSYTEKAESLLNEQGRDYVRRMLDKLAQVEHWDEEHLEEAIRHLSEELGVKLGALAQPLRAAVTGSHMSPGMFEVMAILGKDETIGRMQDLFEEQIL